MLLLLVVVLAYKVQEVAVEDRVALEEREVLVAAELVREEVLVVVEEAVAVLVVAEIMVWVVLLVLVVKADPLVLKAVVLAPDQELLQGLLRLLVLLYPYYHL